MSEEKKESKPALTPDIAKACIEFLNRVDLKGSEARAMVMIQQAISGYIAK